MWCVDLQSGVLSNKEGTIVHITWSADGELIQQLELRKHYSELRKRQLLLDTRQIVLKSLV